MKTKPKYRTLGALLALSSTSFILAENHVENPDAGVTQSTGQRLPRFITTITGTLKPGTTDSFGSNPVDVDVFCFTIDRPVNGATIRVISPDGAFDPNLLLLRDGFYGIAGDDDSGGGINGYDAQITTNLSPGTYYIALGDNNIGAFAASATNANEYSWDNDSGNLSPMEAGIPIVFVGAETVPDASTGQSYLVTFNFQTSDDPATAAIRASLEQKIKKLEKQIKKAKKDRDQPLLKKLKKKLKRLKRSLNSL